MMVPDEPWISALIYVGQLLCVVLSLAPVVVLGVVMVRKLLKDNEAYRGHRRDLLSRGFQPVSKFRTRGRLGGVDVTLDERVATTYAVPLGPEDEAVVVIGTPLSRQRPLTTISAPLLHPLPAPVTVLNRRSMRAPSPAPGARPLAGYSNPLADAHHQVQALDPAWAAAFLRGLAARGGIADLETDGWRVSFDHQRACVERDGMPLPFSDLEAGGARLRVLLERLAGR